MRALFRLVLLLAWLVSASAALAGPTNYFCVVCGKGPLAGHFWIHPRGAICDDCEKLPDHCSICGLPIKTGDGHIQTADGRLICRFDKPDVILTQDQANDLFEQTRSDVVDLYGRQFALKYPNVTVRLFDVDYWSEKGRSGGLHAFGFAHTRKTSNGICTHEVIMLSGRTRDEMTSVAAHEYTHLWINENCPDSHQIDGDTVEAVCELTAYKLMRQKRNSPMQDRILRNPYTNGKIQDLVAVEREGGTDYVLNWIKNSAAATFDPAASLAPLAPAAAPLPFNPPPRVLPAGLKFSGTMDFGREHLAVINGIEFAVGDQKTVKLSDRSIAVHCLAIGPDEISVEVGGRPIKLIRGEEKQLP